MICPVNGVECDSEDPSDCADCNNGEGYPRNIPVQSAQDADGYEPAWAGEGL